MFLDLGLELLAVGNGGKSTAAAATADPTNFTASTGIINSFSIA
jgi:hypothetical protein